MLIPLEGRRRWLFAGLVLFPLAYVSLAAIMFTASHLALRSDLPSLQRAVRLSPGNAEYRHLLGRYFSFVAADPWSAIDNYRAAAALNPRQARYWFDLAVAEQIVGAVSAQRDALLHALQAEPTAPDVAWEAANFFLVQGDTDRALREYRVVMENDPSLALSALQTCWRTRPDAVALLRDVVPPRVDSLLAFETLLQTKHETDGAIAVWDRLMQLHETFDVGPLLGYVRFLIENHRPEVARNAWEQAAGVLDLSNYLPTSDNLIVNGDFSFAILNGGFDWTYQTQPGVHLQLDDSDFREGQRSLSIAFDGPGIANAGIRQWVPVRGNTLYEFTAYHKASEFEGAGGPQLVLRDAYTNQAVFTSDPLNDADFWKAVHGRFTTPASTTLLVLNIERIPPGSPIRGKLWLDDLQLSPASGEEQP
jgi:hypothetical protein